MGRIPTVFPHALGFRPPTAHQLPRPSPIPIPLRPLRAFPAELARLRHHLRCCIPACRRDATTVAALLFDRTRPAATGFRPASAFVSRGDPMAGSRPISPCRPAGRRGRSRSLQSLTPCRRATPSGTPPLRNCMAGRGPPHEFALPRRAHRRRLVANGPATLNKGPAKGS